MRLKTSSAENRKAAQKTTQFGLGGRGAELAKVVEDARVRIELLVLVLGEVVGQHVVAQAVFAAG